MQFRHEVQIVKVCSQFVQIALQCHEVLIAVLRSHCGTNSFSFPHILCCCCSSLALHFLDGQEDHEDHYQNNHQGQGSAEAASNVPLIMGGQALGSEVRVVSELCEAPRRHRHRALEGLGLGAGEGSGKDVEGRQGQECQEVSGAAWRRSIEGHEGPVGIEGQEVSGVSVHHCHLNFQGRRSLQTKCLARLLLVCVALHHRLIASIACS
jgi:hypothetical protein